jgi:hypothetical protein
MVDSGIIAHTRDDSERIFIDKVKYAWDFLPESIRNKFKVDSSSTRQLKFTRNVDGKKSSIFVGTSLRSATVQRLHISELSTVDQQYPNKAKEIKTGALQTVIEKQIVTIESTAKDDVGVYADICKGAMDLHKREVKLTAMDYKFFFFPWFLHPEYELEDKEDNIILITEEWRQYFKKIEDYWKVEISKPKRNWYVKKAKTLGAEMKTEYPSTPEEAFYVNMEGKVYGNQLDLAYKENRIVPHIPHEKRLPCFTYWDIGKGENMFIGIFQFIGKEIRIIDTITDQGDDLAEYIKILKDKPYIYKKHVMPHDAEPTRLNIGGKSIKDQAISLGLTPIEILPPINDLIGITNAKLIFNQIWISESTCEYLIKCLKHFHWEWDDKRECFRKTPYKDWTEHATDMFKYFSVAYNQSNFHNRDDVLISGKRRR